MTPAVLENISCVSSVKKELRQVGWQKQQHMKSVLEASKSKVPGFYRVSGSEVLMSSN